MYARDTKLVQNSQNNRGSFVPKILRSDSTKSIYSPIDQNLLLQRALGNQAYGNMIQAKLKIGQPNDKYEQEADRVAEQVMRMPDTEVSGISKSPETVQRKCAACASGQGLCPKCEEEERIQRTPLASTITPLVQRQIVISDEEEEEEEFLQTRATPGSAPSVTPHIAANINAMRGGGQPLPQSVRAFFELRFGQDFRGVRIHTGAQSAKTAQTINARAFTVGKDIAFGAGQYSPETTVGNKLLAHELTHVVQQKRSIQSNIQRKKPRTDAFGKECPDTVVIGSIKPIAGFNKALFDKGIRTWLGIYSYMKVGPKQKYESCIAEVLKVEGNTCGKKGKLADYKPCTPKKYCLTVGGTKKIPTDPNIFLDMHRSSRDFNLLEGSGKKTCEVTCLQRYGCGGKEIGRFYVSRTFKADTFKDGKKDVPVTLGSIKKVIAKRKK